ncbi:Rieske (2Fe-2S) protein [Streptomyces sp. 6N223]|uniref:Rieske (2Fe-2S) protein n=1 Tax=Streptomyces sp. 6N223 TaxID=3457412 RepID=UPI003FD42182
MLLIRLGDEVRAVSAWCTHMHTLIGAQPVHEDGLVECPLHGAVFDSTDGSLQLGPTCDPLPVFEVTIDAEGEVTVHVDEPAAAPVVRTSGFGAGGAFST